MTPLELVCDLRPAYLNTHGLRVGKSGDVLQVRDKDALKHEIRIGEICQLNLMGNIQVSTQATQSLCQSGIPICCISQSGWFYGITMGMNVKNVYLRKIQYRLADEDWCVLSIARQLIAGKIRNQRTMLLRGRKIAAPLKPVAVFAAAEVGKGCLAGVETAANAGETGSQQEPPKIEQASAAIERTKEKSMMEATR